MALHIAREVCYWPGFTFEALKLYTYLQVENDYLYFNACAYAFLRQTLIRSGVETSSCVVFVNF